MTEASPAGRESSSRQLLQVLGVSSSASSVDEEVYVDVLTSLGIDALHKEGERLRRDRQRLGEDLQDLACRSYGTFLRNAGAVRQAREGLRDVRHGVEAVERAHRAAGECLALQNSAKSGSSSGSGGGGKKTTGGGDERLALARSAITFHPRVVELLEVPQLLETCVRNGFYDEALHLKAYVEKASHLHASLGLVQHIRGDVQRGLHLMQWQLLDRLRAPGVRVPECLRVVGFLRRLAAFHEHELRFRFLQQRDRFLTATLLDLHSSASASTAAKPSPQPTPDDDGDRDTPAGSNGGDADVEPFLTRYLDAFRRHVLDIVVQFRAVFLDDDDDDHPDREREAVDGDDEHDRDRARERGGEAAALHGWILSRVHHVVLTILPSTLPRLRSLSSLAKAFDRALYCAHSLGRVGADFSALLSPLFERAVLALVTSRLAQTLAAWDMPTTYTPAATSSSASAAASASTGRTVGDHSADQLLRIGSGELAVFVNRHRDLWNEARDPPLPIPAVFERLCDVLRDALAAWVAAMLPTSTASPSTSGADPPGASSSSSNAAQQYAAEQCRWAAANIALPAVIRAFDSVVAAAYDRPDWADAVSPSAPAGSDDLHPLDGHALLDHWQRSLRAHAPAVAKEERRKADVLRHLRNAKAAKDSQPRQGRSNADAAAKPESRDAAVDSDSPVVHSENDESGRKADTGDADSPVIQSENGESAETADTGDTDSSVIQSDNNESGEKADTGGTDSPAIQPENDESGEQEETSEDTGDSPVIQSGNNESEQEERSDAV